MAGADKKYEGVAQVYIKGRAQAECRKATVTSTSNDNPVKTMGHGFAGFSDGAGETSIDIESAVPKKGFEKSFMAAVVGKETVQIVYKSGGARHSSTGRFTESTISNDIESPAVTTGKFMGSELDIKGG
jgi:hypothetical protein